MEYRCARCRKPISRNQASVFMRFEHYHIGCTNYDRRRMGQSR